MYTQIERCVEHLCARGDVSERTRCYTHQERRDASDSCAHAVTPVREHVAAHIKNARMRRIAVRTR